jgi:hypothetical protein
MSSGWSGSVNVLLQRRKRQRRIDLRAVVQDVQVVAPEIDDPLAGRVLDVGVPDIPLARDRPVEHRRAARYLVHLEINVPGETDPAATHAIARDAPANRIDLCGQREDLIADPGRRPGARSARRALALTTTRRSGQCGDRRFGRPCLAMLARRTLAVRSQRRLRSRAAASCCLSGAAGMDGRGGDTGASDGRMKAVEDVRQSLSFFPFDVSGRHHDLAHHHADGILSAGDGRASGDGYGK